jgi:hypothetical protein
MFSTVTPFIVLLIVSAGFSYYIRIAAKARSWRVEDFFQAGRNIGISLFTETTWGSNFAFGNSIFYAAWLGYTMGLSALWVQLLWGVGMTAYALLLPRLIAFTENHTLHGFLGWIYGPESRITASIVSVIGLLICFGFEMTFAAQYFARVTSTEKLEWLVVVMGALFVCAFCSIGGFKANSLTDRLSNRFGLLALLSLFGVMLARYHAQLLPALTPASILASATDFSSVTGIYLAGLAFFSLFNIVDMTNWQTVSANSLTTDNADASRVRRVQMRRAMLGAAVRFLIAPVLIGTLIGYFIKVLGQGTKDQSAFMFKLVTDLFPPSSLISIVLVGVITFAFLATSLSGIDSWLLASAQTFSWDLFDYKRLKAVNFNIRELAPEIHEKITRRARWILTILGVFGASVTYYVSKYLWGDLFSLQFVIFGGGLAMLPPLLYGLLHGKAVSSKFLRIAAIAAIIGGYGSALALFAYSLSVRNSDLVSPLPLVSLGVSTVIFLVGLAPTAGALVWRWLGNRTVHGNSL